MNYLILGHDPFSTSTFSRITKHVMDLVSQDPSNSVYVLSLGESIARQFGNVTISPVTDINKQLKECIEYSKPDIVITICDISDNFPLYFYKTTQDQSRSWRWVGIFDIQTMPPPPAFINVVLEMDYILTYSTGIYNFISPNEDIRIIYAPLGVESDTFFPLQNQQDICKKMHEDEKFILLSPGSNNERNYKIGLVEAFSEFSKDKTNAYLYFCDRDGFDYYKLQELSWRYPWIVDKIMLKSENHFELLENHDLNNLYNSVYAVVDVSTNSNFSLSCQEALACGGRVLMTENPLNSPKQYGLPDRIKTIPSNKIINSVGGIENYVIIEEFAKKIEESYLEYKSGIFEKINIDEELFQEFSWNKFDTSLKYIFRNILNIKDSEPISAIL